MAVELRRLYDEVYSDYDVRLITSSCYEKRISWIHMVENVEFIELLQGDELVFNSSLNDADDKDRKEYIDRTIAAGANGLFVALQEGHSFSKALIDYCNSMKFPVFETGWETPYINIMRLFSQILLEHERNEMNLVVALKNAIYYPEDENLYLNHFERNEFAKDVTCAIVVLGCANEESECLRSIEKMLRHTIKQSVIYEEREKLVILAVEYSRESLKEIFTALSDRYPAICVGIGSVENSLTKLHHSHGKALIAYQLAGAVLPGQVLCYDELGIYQILSEIREPEKICPAFVERTLGKLITYDRENKTKYVELLRQYFVHDCSIVRTAQALFFHQNTLKYKIKAIREILGYDILSNENRMKIMLSFYIMCLQEGHTDSITKSEE